MAEDKRNGETRLAPPYVAYKTFRNFIANLQSKGMPAILDRSVMSSLSGSTQSQMTGALKFLGLMDGTDRPTQQLSDLVKVANSDDFSKLLAMIFRPAYGAILEGVTLENTTTGELHKRLTAAGVSGSTVEKALAFFVAAAKEAGIALSPHVKTVRTRPASSNKRPKGRRVDVAETDDEEDDEVRDEGPPAGTRRFPIPVPQLGVEASVVLPEGLTEEIWTMMQTIMNAYAQAMIQKG